MEDLGNIDEDGNSKGVARTTMFNTKTAESDGSLYSVGDAERKDLAYMVEHSCISCNRAMRSSEVKVVPPRYIQERDEYVRNGLIGRRLMCVECYNALKTVTKSRSRYRVTQSARKGFIVKSIINNILLKE